MIGKTVSHYRILEKIGEGGMGVVYLAEDTRLGRKVALKFLARGAALAGEEHKRFIHEAQAAASLSHANISTIYEIEESGDGPFIVMEYIAGESLSDRIAAGPLSVTDSVDLAIQILKGLDQAHSQGIVHRDIKSANVMIKRNGTAKIMDFGLAKLADRTRLTREGTAPGTVAYMSPEQAQGKDVDHRSDIWSAGAVLYEMVTGRRPFPGEYEQAVIYSILNEDPSAPTSLRSGVPMELERIILKALSRDPEERYQHADGMISDLRALRRKTAESTSAIGAATGGTSSDTGRPAAAGAAGTAKKPHRLRTAGIVVSSAAALVILVLVLKSIFFGTPLIAGQKPIAVITFENRTGDPSYDYLAAAIPNLLITSLEQSRHLQVMTWERMQDLLHQTGRERTEDIDKELGFELCELDGIDVVVVGSYVRAGNSFAIEAKVMDVRTKELLQSASTRGEGVESILEKQIDELSRDIAQNVAAVELTEEAGPVMEVTTASMEAYDYFLKGSDYYTRFYFKDAEINLERAVEIDTTFAMAYLYLSMVKNSLIEINDATTALKKAMRYADGANEKYRMLIEADYVGRIENDRERAIAVLDEMTRKYPKEKIAYLKKAKWLDVRENPPEALEAFEKALQLDPEYGDALNSMGYALMDLTEYEKALEYFTRYAAVNPGDPNPHDSMADCLYRMGRIEEAKAHYRKAFGINPEFFPAKMGLAYLYGLQWDYDSSMVWMDSAIESIWRPAMRSVALMWKAVLLHSTGRLKESYELERDTYRLMMEETDHPRREVFTKSFLIWFYYAEGRYGDSREMLEHVENKYNESGLVMPPSAKISLTMFRGLLAVRSGRLGEARAAVAAMDTLVSGPYFEANKGDVMQCRRMPLLLEAEVLLAEGRPFDAIDLMKKKDRMYTPRVNWATLGFYNLPREQDVVARSWIALGNSANAIEEYERLITFDPASADRRLRMPVYHYRLALLYEKEGRVGLAAKNYERYLEYMKRADEGIFEVDDAKARLERIRKSS